MRRRAYVAAATVAVFLSGILAACSGAGSSGGSALSANSPVTFAEYAGGGTSNFIFPMSGPDYFTTANFAQLWFHLWLPLYWTGSSTQSGTLGVNEALSLAYPPVYSDNNHVITILLKNYEWSDGTPVTCRDVEFWMNLWKSDPSDHFGYSITGVTPNIVSSYTCANQRTVVFHVPGNWSPSFVTPNLIDYIRPLPQHAWDKTSVNGRIGNYDETTSGALAVYNFLAKQGTIVKTFATNPLWKVVDSAWTLSQATETGQLTFTRNPRFSGPDKPYFHTFVELPFTSDASEFNAVLTGSVDYGYLPFADVPQLKRVEALGYRLEPWYEFAFNSFMLNYSSSSVGPILRQLYIRQALAHLVDQPQYVQAIYHGLALQGYGPLPPVTPGQPQQGQVFSWQNSGGTTNPYPFSTSAAANLLTSHGWHVVANGSTTCADAAKCGPGISTGEKIQLSIEYPTELPETTAELEAYKSAASNVGIAITLDPLPQATLDAVLGGTCSKASCWQLGDFGGSLFGYFSAGVDGGMVWESTGDADFSLPDFGCWPGEGVTCSSAPGAQTLYNLISQARAETTQAGYAQAMKSYDEYAAKELPLIFLPLQYFQLSLIKNTLGPIAQNAIGLSNPELWRPAH
jgi:peptide/nickel transport system substrate-binding protein